MDFNAALDYLYSALDLGVKPGLVRITELMRRLGNPQNDYPIIHIAGTNGKGSVSAYCSHVAAVCDKKCAWFTSPHLENFNERIRIIDGRKGLEDFEQQFRSPEIPDADFAALMEEIKPQIENMLKDGFEHPTVFEILTAAAYLYFSQQKVDLAVIEVGMGGLLDSTNVVDKSLVSVITALGYDHMDRLGNSLREIARQKAGIIKPACPVVLYNPEDAVASESEGQEALTAVKEIAAEKAAELIVVSAGSFTDSKVGRYEQNFRLKGSERLWRIKLRGEYQKMNAALAIEACRYFATEEQIAEGLARTTWPGRLELMQDEPPVMIDGAHNVQGCTALAAELQKHFPHDEFIYLVAVLADKEHKRMLSLVLDNKQAPPYRVYCTEAPVPRKMNAEDLAKEVAEILNVTADEIVDLNKEPDKTGRIYYQADLERATRQALAAARKTGKGLLAFGSLYAIGDLRPYLREELWGEEICPS